MINSNLIEILQTLSKEDLLSFQEYVHWTMRNQPFDRAESLNLLEIILKHFPNFTHKSLEKEAVFKQMYPGKPFVERKIDKIMVNLTKCLRAFQLHQYYMRPENEFNQLLDILQVYKINGLSARYQQAFRQLETLVQEKKEVSLKSIFQNFQFEYEKMDWSSLYNNQKSDINLTNTIKEFDHYQKLMLSDLISRYLLQKKLINLHPPPFLAEIIEAEAQRELSDTSSLLLANQFFIKLLIKNDVSVTDFNQVIEIVINNESDFDYETLFFLHTYLRNLCVLLINQGHKEFQHTLFDLQKTSINSGYRFYKGKISSSAYVSAVTVALVVKELEWAINFIESNKDIIIGETHDKIYYRFCYANYLFAMQKFDTVIDYLPLSITELSFTLIARRLELKTYYELKSDLADFKLETFKMFVVRLPQKNLPPDTIAFNANFARIFSQLLNSKKGSKQRGQKLIQRIAEKRLISDREWLYEKAREIGNISEVEALEIIKNTPTVED